MLVPLKSTCRCTIAYPRRRKTLLGAPWIDGDCNVSTYSTIQSPSILGPVTQCEERHWLSREGSGNTRHMRCLCRECGGNTREKALSLPRRQWKDTEESLSFSRRGHTQQRHCLCRNVSVHTQSRGTVPPVRTDRQRKESHRQLPQPACHRPSRCRHWRSAASHPATLAGVSIAPERGCRHF